MKRKTLKHVSALTLTFITLIGLVLSNRLVSLFHLFAGPTSYTHTLKVSDGPGEGAEKIGEIKDEVMTLYYSTNSSLTSDHFLILSATDEKTPGVLLNLTVINGLSSVKVSFSGGPLYAISTRTMFENFSPVAENLLSSDVAMDLGDGFGSYGYLLILTPSTTDVTIDEITFSYTCDHEVDDDFIIDPQVNHYTGARSYAKSYEIGHDLVRFKTNPTPTNNNYSTGTTDEKNNFWYRFNGISSRNYALVAGEKDFTATPHGNTTSYWMEVTTTVMVDPKVFYDPNAFFCAAPWLALSTTNHEVFPDNNDYIWLQSYIGNDNFDPLVGVNTLGRDDTYTGRFFTNFAYDSSKDEYRFQDPDETLIVDGELTLREAYETINLPFFNVKFEIYGNDYRVFINGIKVFEETEAFYAEEDFDEQPIYIERIELQGVNYGSGVGSDAYGIATPLPNYELSFSNPIFARIPR